MHSVVNMLSSQDTIANEAKININQKIFLESHSHRPLCGCCFFYIFKFGSVFFSTSPRLVYGISFFHFQNRNVFFSCDLDLWTCSRQGQDEPQRQILPDSAKTAKTHSWPTALRGPQSGRCSVLQDTKSVATQSYLWDAGASVPGSHVCQSAMHRSNETTTCPTHSGRAGNLHFKHWLPPTMTSWTALWLDAYAADNQFNSLDAVTAICIP